jgi:hypothetical protein
MFGKQLPNSNNSFDIVPEEEMEIEELLKLYKVEE